MDTNIKARIRPFATKTQKQYVEGWDVLSRMKQLTMLGKSSEMINDVHKHFNRAQRYEFNKLAAEFSTYLQYYYFLIGDKRKGEKYSTLSLKYSKLSHLENIVLVKFAMISYKLNNTSNANGELTNQLREICTELKSYLVYESSTIWIATYTLFNVLAYIDQKDDTVIKQSYEVIAYLEEKQIERSAYFYKDMTPALIRQGQYNKATVAIDHAITNIPKGSSSWSVFVYYRTIIELHRGDYVRAFEIFQEAERKRQINKSMRENWLIIKGYMKFLQMSGKIEGNTDFKLGKFLNNVEVFDKDKSGQNINIIILKIILRLKTDRDSIIEEQEAVQKYANRYIKKDSRARVFFHMLNQITVSSFSKNIILNKSKKYSNQLKKQIGYDPSIETIPYNVLWSIILQNLVNE